MCVMFCIYVLCRQVDVRQASISDKTMRVRVLLFPCYLHEGDMTVSLQFFR